MNKLSFDDLATIDFDDITAVDTSGDEHTYIEKCLKCNGTGKWVGGFRNHVVRKCFACNGAGHKEFKTSPEVRKANKIKANAAKLQKIADSVKSGEDFLKSHPDVNAWIEETANWSDFSKSLLESCYKFGSLTDGQLAAAKRAAEKHFAKKAAQADQKTAVQINTAGLKPILEAFEKAQENGLKRPKLRLDGFQLSLAPATGKNAGSIYVKDGSEYLGKISAEGQFLKPRSLSPELAKEIDEKLILVGQNPMEAAVAYGKRTGECSCCGRELSREDSIERGMGAICAEKYGF